MKPAQVLDHHVDLQARLTRPLARRAWTEHLVLDHADVVAADVARYNAEASVGYLQRAVRQAAAFHVRPEMCTLLTYAASQLGGTDAIDTTLAPTASGFVRFETPLAFQDARGMRLLVSWIIWGPIKTAQSPDPGRRMTLAQLERARALGRPGDAMGVWLFNDQDDHPDDAADRDMGWTDAQVARVRAELGRWGLIGTTILTDEQRVGPAFTAPTAEKAAEVLADGQMPTSYSNAARLVHAFWLMLNQTVVRSSDGELDRASRKRAGRAGLPPRVTVIELRRTEGSRGDGESLVEWSHRWIVRGHWRNQRVSEHHPLAVSAEGGGFVARIWVAPFVKGPEGMPLVVSDKVYAVVR